MESLDCMTLRKAYFLYEYIWIANPVMGYYPTGHVDWGKFLSGVSLLSVGITAYYFWCSQQIPGIYGKDKTQNRSEKGHQTAIPYRRSKIPPLGPGAGMAYGKVFSDGICFPETKRGPGAIPFYGCWHRRDENHWAAILICMIAQKIYIITGHRKVSCDFLTQNKLWLQFIWNNSDVKTDIYNKKWWFYWQFGLIYIVGFGKNHAQIWCLPLVVHIDTLWKGVDTWDGFIFAKFGIFLKIQDTCHFQSHLQHAALGSGHKITGLCTQFPVIKTGSGFASDPVFIQNILTVSWFQSIFLHKITSLFKIQIFQGWENDFYYISYHSTSPAGVWRGMGECARCTLACPNCPKPKKGSDSRMYRGSAKAVRQGRAPLQKVMDLIAGMRLDDTAVMLKTGSCLVPWFPRPI